MGLWEFDLEFKKVVIWIYYEGVRRNGELGLEVICILYIDIKDCWFWYILFLNGMVSVGVVGDNDYVFKGCGRFEEIFVEEVVKCLGI